MIFTPQLYYRSQKILEIDFISLTHTQRQTLADIYSAFTGERPADVYCDECMREVYHRIQKEVIKFVSGAKEKTA